MELLFIIALAMALTLWFKLKGSHAKAAGLEQKNGELLQAVAERERKIQELARAVVELTRLQRENGELALAVAERDQKIREITQTISERDRTIQELAPYQHIIDTEAHVRRILAEAEESAKGANAEAARIRREANEYAKTKVEQSDDKLLAAGQEAAQIIAAAKKRAEEIAGEAYAIKGRADEFADAAHAMQNVIKGYGNEYIIPTYSLLDELADEFGHTEAGDALKQARNTTRALIRAERAATCDYAEETRRKIAINFVIDAFNGKVDSILARTKADNPGKLEQEIRDSFALVNHSGRAFRNARINPEYLEARVAELKWAAVARALKEQEREEQRRIREQIREEEKARREYERAMKEAAKEEDLLRKAMEKVQHLAEAANAEQRAQYEAKLAELHEKLQAAEEKSQRALSMAQQTKSGHVYVISNIGSFGEEVFKIGMTRRLEPKDRIRELGDASVPFEFDIHAMLYSEDAPGLERTLHRRFLRKQVNKVNPRKEFFRVSLQDIRSEIETMGLPAHWTMTADAHDYRESLRIEQQIQENPELEREWTHHQIELEAAEDFDIATEDTTEEITA